MGSGPIASLSLGWSLQHSAFEAGVVAVAALVSSVVRLIAWRLNEALQTRLQLMRAIGVSVNEAATLEDAAGARARQRASAHDFAGLEDLGE